MSRFLKVAKVSDLMMSSIEFQIVGAATEKAWLLLTTTTMMSLNSNSDEFCCSACILPIEVRPHDVPLETAALAEGARAHANVSWLSWCTDTGLHLTALS